MRKLFAVCSMLLLALPATAAIKFFTDYPNSTPADSDFFVLQRSQSYINSSPAQVRTTWFNNPVFTGNGSINGNFTAAFFIGDGSLLTGISSSSTVTNVAQYFSSLNTNYTDLVSNLIYQANLSLYVLANNGNSTNQTNWGISTYQNFGAEFAYLTNIFTFRTNAPLLSTDGDGLIQNGSPLAATNVTLIPGANVTFTTNGAGAITITVSGTISGSFAASNVFSGGFLAVPLAFNAITNTGATASTVASYDANKALTSVANALGALTNNGSGVVGYYNNFVPDARTVTIAGTANQVTSSAGAQDLSANRTWTLSVPSVFTAPGTIAAVTGMTNQSLTTPGVMTNDDKGKLLSTPTLPNALLANSSITIQGSAVSLGGTTLAVASTPNFNAINITNSPYIMGTNNGGGNALVSGSPGTAATMYLTNITADTTLAAATFWNAGGSVIPLYCSCSGGANKILKFPANFQGAGDLYGIDLNGTGVTITNGEASWFEVRCIYGVKTNVFRSNTK